MSFVPQYQWLTEFKELKCGGCDKIYLNGNSPNDFQVRFIPELILDEQFDGNATADPMEQITFGGSGTTYGIVFDIDLTNASHFINSFSFFYNGVGYSYVFTAGGTGSGGEHIYDNFHVIDIGISPSSMYQDYQAQFNAHMNQFGIYAFPDIATPTIALVGFPEGTQVTFSPTSPISEGLCGGSGSCAEWYLKDFIPVDSQLCFFQVDELDGSGSNSPYIYKEFVIPANKRVIFTVNFTNSFASPIDMQLIIEDDSMAVLDVMIKTALPGTNTLIFSYDVGASPPPSFFFKFLIVPVSDDEIADSFVGFCYNQIKIETINKLIDVSTYSCGELLSHYYDESYNGVYNSLITITTDTPDIFQIRLQDTENNFWTSIVYEKITELDCTKRNYMNLKWWSDCAFYDLDYKNLPFVNEVYIQGWSVKLPKVNKERIVNTLSSGELQQIYNHSLRKRQFNIGLYTEVWLATLERAFEHKFIEVDSVSYVQDTDSDLVPKPENDQKFTSRIDLIESGSAVVISSCCCD